MVRIAERIATDMNVPVAPTLRAPIVLLHGLCGFDRILVCRRPVKEYFPGIGDSLRAAGNRVLVPRLSPTAGVATRAAELLSYLKREVGPQPVHVVGHSLGGLDARYMISKLGGENRVLSLTTIGTPHRGTTFADWGLYRMARFFRPLLRAAGLPEDAFHDLTIDACRRFNEDVPDAPGVRYASVAGVCERPLLAAVWWLPSRIVAKAEGPNDGVVSLASATWGERTDVWNADHLNLVNWPNRKARRRGLWTDRAADYGRLLARLEQ
jgi:triacylglycerol lipase